MVSIYAHCLRSLARHLAGKEQQGQFCDDQLHDLLVMNAGWFCDRSGSRSSSAREGLVWRLGSAGIEPLWCQLIVSNLMCSGTPPCLNLLPMEDEVLMFAWTSMIAK